MFKLKEKREKRIEKHIITDDCKNTKVEHINTITLITGFIDLLGDIILSTQFILDQKLKLSIRIVNRLRETLVRIIANFSLIF